nr:MAG TPA: hypothetical protein [Caudoviricetes sp.]
MTPPKGRGSRDSPPPCIAAPLQNFPGVVFKPKTGFEVWGNYYRKRDKYAP